MKKYNYIYLITNNANGKIYIGKHSTNNLDDGYMGSGKLILKAEKKYGLENFTKEYLAFCDTEEKLNYLEKFYIKKYKAKEVGYNLTDGGDGGSGKHTQEFKDKISKLFKAYWKIRKLIPISDETRRKLSKARKGKKHSDETKHKISASQKGIKRGPMNLSDEQRKKMSERSKYNASHISEETRIKRSVALKGKKRTKEQCEKISKALKGKKAYNKGTKAQKFKWLTPSGEIKEMDINNVKRWHKDWILYEIDKDNPGVKFWVD